MNHGLKAYGNTQVSFFYYRKLLSERKSGVSERISGRKQKTFG